MHIREIHENDIEAVIELFRKNYGDDYAIPEFYDPQWVNAVFRGREASITVKAWGGFTVGAWLPEQQIELECDLALLPDSPMIVREL